MLYLFLNSIDDTEGKTKFEQMYYTYRRIIKYVCLDILKDEQLAEDAVYDSFIKMIKHIDRIEDINSIKTKAFITIIAKNTAKNILRKEKLIQSIPIEVVYNSIPEMPKLDSFDAKEISDQIQKLPEKYRDAVLLKFYYHLKEKEIAKILNVTYLSARKRIKRAKYMLADNLKEWSECNV